MNGTPDDQGAPPRVDEELEDLFRDPDAQRWMTGHLSDLRRSVSEHRFRNQVMWFCLVGGLVFHVGGYLLRLSGPGEPLGFVADLLYSLGFALWTGTVVVVLIEIVPQAKERQILGAIDAYEAALKATARSQRR